jgi:hypothetical protein
LDGQLITERLLLISLCCGSVLPPAAVAVRYAAVCGGHVPDGLGDGPPYLPHHRGPLLLHLLQEARQVLSILLPLRWIRCVISKGDPIENLFYFKSVFWIRIRVYRIHVFFGLPDPDPYPLVRGMDPDPALDPDPDPSIIMQK